MEQHRACFKRFSLWSRGCRIDQVFWQEYGEEAHVGRYGAVSMPSQATGRCSLYRMRLASQTSFQIYPETLNTATNTQHNKLL